MLGETFQPFIDWYLSNINYFTITVLMAIESSFVPLPSELVIPPAAYLAVKGELNLGLIIFFSTIGCIIGALFNYALSFYLGRKIIYGLAGSRWARIFFITPEKVEHAERYFLKNGNTSTFIGRLLPGIRHLISIPAGLSKMNLKKFIIYTALGSALWNAILAVMSYILVDKWEAYFREITWGFIIIGVGFVIYLVVRALKNKKEQVVS
ncbi:MAG: DedA family protein [Verrucomicrobia bacterium]|nr:DedA family protein [Prolixibacteraceae bacterium]